MAYIPSCEEEKQFLKSFDPGKYKNPAVAADAALFAIDRKALNILLIRRRDYPYKGCWALPGGFVDVEEDLAAAVQRELFEETGICGVYLEQVFCLGKPERDPRQRVITVSFTGIADITPLSPSAGDDAAEAAWFVFSDYSEDRSKDSTIVSYTLSGADVLRPLVRYKNGRIQQIEAADSGGLAFDHAESIAYSYAYLMQRAKTGLLELAFDDEALRACARHMLIKA